MADLNYDPRPPGRRLEESEQKAQADKVAEGLIAFGQIAMVLGVTVFAIILLISLL